MIGRSYYMGADYSPGEASQYAFGSVIPNPRMTLARRLQLLRSQPGDNSSVSADNFQKFLLLQQNPEALGLSKMKLPDTKFGNMASFLGYGSADQ